MKDWEKLEPDVTKLLTKHFTSRSSRTISYLVVHYNAGDLTVEGCYSVWQSREASAQYQVESAGRIGRLVKDKDIAWHAGNWTANTKSIGIEHANRPDGTITAECLDNGAHLVAALCKKYGLGRPEWLKNVFPHKYFVATSCPGQIYGTQKDAYIKRAQEWYDYMVGNGGKPSNTQSSTGSSSSSSTLDLGDTDWFGTKCAKALEQAMHTTQDGYISGQPTSNKKYFWAVSGGVQYGSSGSACIGALQSFLKARGYDPNGIDGYYGKGCITAHQQWLKAKGYYTGKVDGYHGHETNAAMCKALVAGAYK